MSVDDSTVKILYLDGILKVLREMRIVFCLGVVMFAASCTHVVFDKPQPSDTESLAAFPASYRGIYHVESESMDSLIIDRTLVTFVEHSKYAIPVGDLDTMLHISLKDGLLYDAEMMRAEGVPYQIVDSMILYEYHDRFVLGISDTLIVKQKTKYLVVNSNFKDDDLDYWDVVLVEKMQNGDLVISTNGNLNPPGDETQPATGKGELTYFGKIAPYEQLSENTFLFKPTPRQFHKLIRKNLFSERQVYRQIK